MSDGFDGLDLGDYTVSPETPDKQGLTVEDFRENSEFVKARAALGEKKVAVVDETVALSRQQSVARRLEELSTQRARVHAAAAQTRVADVPAPGSVEPVVQEPVPAPAQEQTQAEVVADAPATPATPASAYSGTGVATTVRLQQALRAFDALNDFERTLLSSRLGLATQDQALAAVSDYEQRVGELERLVELAVTAAEDHAQQAQKLTKALHEERAQRIYWQTQAQGSGTAGTDEDVDGGAVSEVASVDDLPGTPEPEPVPVEVSAPVVAEESTPLPVAVREAAEETESVEELEPDEVVVEPEPEQASTEPDTDVEAETVEPESTEEDWGVGIDLDDEVDVLDSSADDLEDDGFDPDDDPLGPDDGGLG